MNTDRYTPPMIAATDIAVEQGFAISTQHGIEDWDKQEF